MGLSRAADGNFYVSGSYFLLNRILEVTPAGNVSVLIDGLPAMPWDAQVEHFQAAVPIGVRRATQTSGQVRQPK